MQLKQSNFDTPARGHDMFTTVDESEPTNEFCLANIGENDDHYMSCGERIYIRKNSNTYCLIHGDMH